jgi:hypothetical protein
MTPSETAELLALCAAFDSRTIGEADVYAWQSVLETVDLETAKDAVRAWYAQHRERIMPADVNIHAKAVRDARFALEQRQRAFGPRLALAPAPGKVGQRAISEPSPWYVQAKETLARIRSASQDQGVVS